MGRFGGTCCGRLCPQTLRETAPAGQSLDPWKGPRQYGFDFGLSTRRIVQSLVQQKMGIELGLTAVGRLLVSLNITPQKLRRRAYERDPVAIIRWMEEALPRTQEACAQGGGDDLFPG